MISIFNKWVNDACSPMNKHRWFCRIMVFLMLLFVPIFMFMLSIAIPIWMKGC